MEDGTGESTAALEAMEQKLHTCYNYEDGHEEAVTNEDASYA